DTIPPLLSAGLRFSFAGAILFTLYFIEHYRKKSLSKGKINTKANHILVQDLSPNETKVEREPITLKQWKDSLILGVTLFLGGQGLLTWGAQYLSSGMTGLLNSTIPLWVAILLYILYRWIKKSNDGLKLTKLTTMGLICGIGGLMLLVAPSIGSGEINPIVAAALIISSVSWAAGSIYSTKSKLPVSMLASSGMIMLTGGLMLAGVSFLFGEYKSLDLFQI